MLQNYGKFTFFKIIAAGLIVPIIIYHIVSQFNGFRTGEFIVEEINIKELKFTLGAENGNEVENSKSKCTKQILFASSWYAALGSKFPYFDEATSACPSCTFTQDMALLNSSDAVVLHGMSMTNKPSLNRSFPDQIYIWMYEEPPIKGFNHVNKLKNYPNFFNWTMTYRQDSDVPFTYGLFIRRNETPMPGFNERWAFMASDITKKNDIYNDKFIMRTPTEKELKGRKLVAWISSNCGSESVKKGREKLVKELRNYIPIDHYGRCGNFSCGRKAGYLERTSITGNSGIDCRFKIAKSYKFFLSFENSLCEDYVTDKYFDTLFTNMVPIVYGSAKYSEFAPPKSFINVADFANAEGLANYLKFLDKNTTEYLKYFEWRKEFWVQNNNFVIAYCSLCNKLCNPGPPKFYADPRAWYNRASDYKISGRNACLQPNEFVFKNITRVD